MSKLTNTQIKNAKAKDKAYTLSDGLGLSLLINTNETKWWRYRFQFNSKAKMMSLGTYPDISLADVRKRLAEARSLVAKGINPIEVKQDEKQQQTIKDNSILFKDVAVEYLNSIQANVSEAHHKRSTSLLKHHATPILGNNHIKDITIEEIQSLVTTLSKAGKKESASKLHAVLKKLFVYAKAHNHCKTNIAKLIETEDLFTDPNKRKFPTITEPKKIKALLANIRGYEGGHYSTKYALLFMALTSLRTANVRHARWEQIDFKTNTMTIPKAEMKIKRTALLDAVDFRLPLSTQTIDLLKEVKKLSGHGIYIFPSILGDRAMSENAMLVMIRSLDYTQEEFTPHGFRAMFATIANEKDNGFDRDLIDAQLAHKVGNSVSQSYNRTDYLEKRRKLVQWWANWLYSL